MKGKVKDAEDSAFAHLSAVAGDPEQAQRDAQAAAQRLDGEDRALARTRELTAKLMDHPHNPAGAAAQTLLGVLGTSWVAIIGSYFGSSLGSKEKTALLAERGPVK